MIAKATSHRIVRRGSFMLHKLTVFALVLLIGSPVCWCGWMHQSKRETNLPACCQVKGKATEHHQTSSSEHSDCPCAHAPKVREMAPGKVTVPDAKLLGFVFAPWSSLEIPQAAETSMAASVWSSIHGPPITVVPLYLRHCAWLL
jgi:hypothetical protein